MVVRLVSDVFLRPNQVLHHHAEEEEKSEQMCPDVDSLVVEFKDTLDTVIIAQTSSVAGFNRNFFGKVRDLLYAEQLCGIILLHIITVVLRYHRSRAV